MTEFEEDQYRMRRAFGGCPVGEREGLYRDWTTPRERFIHGLLKWAFFGLSMWWIWATYSPTREG
jgi:hypothetical protein